MRRMLRSLATGDFCTQTIVEKRSPEHQKASDTAYGLLEQMEKKLNSEEKELFEKAVDALITEHSYSEANEFIRGFRLGAILILEILENTEEFYSEFGA